MKKLPKNKCWIVGIGNDDFKHHPCCELISRVKKHNKDNPKEKFRMYRKKETVQGICDHLNSL